MADWTLSARAPQARIGAMNAAANARLYESEGIQLVRSSLRQQDSGRLRISDRDMLLQADRRHLRPRRDHTPLPEPWAYGIGRSPLGDLGKMDTPKGSLVLSADIA